MTKNIANDDKATPATCECGHLENQHYYGEYNSMHAHMMVHCSGCDIDDPTACDEYRPPTTPDPRPAPPKVERIRITGCSHSMGWYKDEIGKEFEVLKRGVLNCYIVSRDEKGTWPVNVLDAVVADPPRPPDGGQALMDRATKLCDEALMIDHEVMTLPHWMVAFHLSEISRSTGGNVVERARDFVEETIWNNNNDLMRKLFIGFADHDPTLETILNEMTVSVIAFTQSETERLRAELDTAKMLLLSASHGRPIQQGAIDYLNQYYPVAAHPETNGETK